MPAHRTRRRVLLGLVAVLGLLLVPAPAQAHPFGPPQTVTISVDDEGGVVEVHWRPGAADDYSYLAVGLGLSAEDRTQEPGALMHVRKDAELLAASPLFAEYLTRHVAVRDGTGSCRGTVRPTGHLVTDGAAVRFDCGRPVEDVDVRVSLMTDLHPAYRTMATGPHGQRFVYTSTATEHAWSSTAAPDSPAPGRSALTQMSVVGGALVVLTAGVALPLRRNRRRRTHP